MAKKPLQGKAPEANLPSELPEQPNISIVAPALAVSRTNAIEQMEELRHRQKAIEVRRNAEQLFFTLELAKCFHDCVLTGRTISGDTQAAVNRAFDEAPEFHHMQQVLTHVAGRSVDAGNITRTPTVKPRSEMFPSAELTRIVLGFMKLVVRYSNNLSQEFPGCGAYRTMSKSPDNFLFIDSDAGLLMLFGSPVTDPIRIYAYPEENAEDVRRELQVLLEQLRTSPSQVVAPPAYSEKCPPVWLGSAINSFNPGLASGLTTDNVALLSDRLRVDRPKNVIWVADKPFNCEELQVLFVELLLSATSYVSFTDAKEKIPGLELFSRGDRFVKSIPKEIRKCLHSDTRGYRIRDEWR